MRRQREQHYASHYHWIQLHFYPGLLAKLIKTGQQWSPILPHSKQEARNFSVRPGVESRWHVFVSDPGTIVAGGNLELPLGNRWVLQSSQLFNKKHNSPLIVPLLPGLVWWHFASPMKAGEILVRQLLRDHSYLNSPSIYCCHVFSEII